MKPGIYKLVMVAEVIVALIFVKFVTLAFVALNRDANKLVVVALVPVAFVKIKSEIVAASALKMEVNKFVEVEFVTEELVEKKLVVVELVIRDEVAFRSETVVVPLNIEESTKQFVSNGPQLCVAIGSRVEFGASGEANPIAFAKFIKNRVVTKVEASTVSKSL
jgi:hypothetical protein